MKKIAAFVTCFIMGATPCLWAADWNFYGSARVRTFYDDVDGTGTSTRNLTYALQSNSRIGAKVKVSDTLAGRFEYGASGGNANLRHLYGEWTFGPGRLLVGQTDSPLNFSLSNQVYDTDANMDPYGHVDAKRQPMVQLTFGDFKIAAIEPDTSDLNLAGPTTEGTLPKIEASYRFNMDHFFIDLAAGYGSYTLKEAGTAREYDVDSYIFAVGGQARFGKAYLGGDVWVGQNVGPYNYNCSPDGDPRVESNALIDNDAYGFMVAGGYKLNDTFSFEAGYGYVTAELDHANYQEDDTTAYYVQSTVTLADGVFFVPEIGRVDKNKDKSGATEEDTVYYGIKWQINF